MSRTTAQAFDHFYDNYLKPTGPQVQEVSSKKQTTNGYLTSAFPANSSLPLNRVVLIGSAARGTHTQPLDDIDVLAHFTNEDNVFDAYRNDSSAFLQRIRKALDAKTSIKLIGARGQAVRLFYKSGAHVDIAPVFKWSGGGYALPDGAGKWITTDPEEQAKWFTQRKELIGSNLNELVRFTKRWNAVHSGRFSSFHLEVLVATMFTNVGSNTRKGLDIFFEKAQNWIDVADPAGHSGSLSGYLTYDQRSKLLARLSSAHDRSTAALTAEDRGDHEEAKRLWKIELGDQFPLS